MKQLYFENYNSFIKLITTIGVLYALAEAVNFL